MNEKRFILAGAATYGGCYSPLTKEQLTAAESTPHSKGILPFNVHLEPVVINYPVTERKGR
ncbi:MAG TPA: hypothetical protein GXX19_11690 [Syntrophomonadaceae bacterium]|nr:hypothetical protein [Syntrophomonadaceae bacterium]